MALNQNALQIDPETGALLVNNLRIEPDWVVEELKKSDFFKKYIYDDELEKVKTFFINNLNDKELIINIFFNIKKMLIIDGIELKFPHGSRAENEIKRFDDFKAFREILVENFKGYKSEVDRKDYMSYLFQWGSVVLCIEHRELCTNLHIYYTR